MILTQVAPRTRCLCIPDWGGPRIPWKLASYLVRSPLWAYLRSFSWPGVGGRAENPSARMRQLQKTVWDRLFFSQRNVFFGAGLLSRIWFLSRRFFRGSCRRNCFPHFRGEKCSERSSKQILAKSSKFSQISLTHSCRQAEPNFQSCRCRTDLARAGALGNKCRSQFSLTATESSEIKSLVMYTPATKSCYFLSHNYYMYFLLFGRLFLRESA